ncbi:SSI family serine proteinase inhibitor [Dactylosporangium sp. NPDC005572]|uniref:SSI family serine proteinase inhibitor n=1 Tax=Dactylosporangium sp. NPDC005572 TaxID=3156889 RepID=UPI0033B601DC
MGVLGLAGAVTAATIMVTAVLTADAAHAAPKPTLLTLTVARDESTKPAQHRAFLTCSPAGGTHKQARDACAELAKVHGDFGRLQVAGGACTMQYDPVTVTAQGRWQGRKVAYRHTFGNSCTMSTATGPVFSL